VSHRGRHIVADPGERRRHPGFRERRGEDDEPGQQVREDDRGAGDLRCQPRQDEDAAPDHRADADGDGRVQPQVSFQVRGHGHFDSRGL
jgi:hypothetical protein